MDSTGNWPTLRRGECYSLGYAYNEHTRKLEVNRYFKIRVKSLDERFQS